MSFKANCQNVNSDNLKIEATDMGVSVWVRMSSRPALIFLSHDDARRLHAYLAQCGYGPKPDAEAPMESVAKAERGPPDAPSYNDRISSLELSVRQMLRRGA